MTKKVTDKVLAFKNVFGTPEGKKVLATLSNFCGLMRTSYATNDPMAIARNEGRREVILEIISILRMKNEDVQALIDAEFEIENIL